MSMTSREQFEAWWVRGNDGLHPRSGWEELRTDDGYNDEFIDMQYDGFKAAEEIYQRQQAAVVAENAELKAICDDRREFIMNGVQLGYIKVPTVETDPALETIRIAVSPQAPSQATDEFLAEVRAQGVEMLKDHVNKWMLDMDFPSEMQFEHAEFIQACDEFAAQLRQGAEQ